MHATRITERAKKHYSRDSPDLCLNSNLQASGAGVTRTGAAIIRTIAEKTTSSPIPIRHAVTPYHLCRCCGTGLCGPGVFAADRLIARGGVLAELSDETVEDVAGSMLMLRTGEIETMLKRVNELGGEVIIEDIKYGMSYEKLLEALKSFATYEAIGMNEVDEISKTFLVKKNVLFVDPLTKLIKTQSQLNLLAIREVMQDA